MMTTMMTTKTINPEELRYHWRNRIEIVLLDVREEGPYALAHPLFACTLPVSEIEYKLPALAPRLSVPIVVYDDGEGYVERAAASVIALGYTDVAILEGGMSAYARVGELYRDVNVPSKAFGELVEAIRGTPSLAPRDIQEVLDKDKDVVVLDVRRYEEYNTMSIPHGQSCPGGELLYRIFEAAPSPDTTVVVHCAGRTRGLIGTQSLVNAGIPNKVMALRDGTIGWTLAGMELETSKDKRAPAPSKEAAAKSRALAESWAQHAGVTFIDSGQLLQFVSDASRTIYLLDVRDPREYARGHPDGFLSAPGGQLVQATDEWIAVRGARIVLYDTDGVRARMTATWLLQLGWEVYVFQTGAPLPASISSPKPAPCISEPRSGGISIEELDKLQDATIIDLARSPAYRRGHIRGAWHASGPELARDLANVSGTGPIVLTSPDGLIASFNVEHARKSTTREIMYLTGGTTGWQKAGKAQEKEEHMLSPPIDVYKRPYEGTGNDREAMEGYIEWEHQLVAQLANDGVSCFHVIRDTRTVS